MTKVLTTGNLNEEGKCIDSHSQGVQPVLVGKATGPLHPQSGGREDECGCPGRFLLFIQDGPPAGGMALPTFRLSPLSSVKAPWEHTHGNMHKCVSMVILDSIKLSMKVDHFVGCVALDNANRKMCTGDKGSLGWDGRAANSPLH